MMKFRAILSPSDRHSEIFVYTSFLEMERIALAVQEDSTCTRERCDLRTIKEELEGTIVDNMGEREKHEVMRVSIAITGVVIAHGG